MNGHALRELAQAWATVAHDGQSRKGAGEPYINHPTRVAEAVWGWRAKTLAYLHDTIEDSDDPEQMFKAIRLLFGDEITRDLMLLTRLPRHNWLVVAYSLLDLDLPLLESGDKEPYQEWIKRLASQGNEDVIRVKLADIEDNLKDISDIPNARGLESRYLKAKAVLLEALGEQ